MSDFSNYLRIYKRTTNLSLIPAQKNGEFMQNFIEKILTGFTFVILLTAILSIDVSAATFTVLNTSNTGVGSLRQAVTDSNSAAGSDTIVFDSGVFGTPQTITLASVISINPATGDSLTITGPGANLLTISGNNAVRIFTVSANDTASISGITFTQAVTGAIISGGTLTVTNSTFNANTNNGGASEGGGAISTKAGVLLTVIGCTFTNNTNTAPGINGAGGGAIYNGAGVTAITNSTFTNNMTIGGAGGGAVNIDAGTMTITSSTFTGNSTTFDAQNSRGGAINVFGSGQLNINNSVITGNSTVRDGGGIYFQPTSASVQTLTITNSTISNNIANSDSNTTGNGGGLLLTGTGSATITGSTIGGNTAIGSGGLAGNGGGINSSAILNLTNSTVSGNTAGRDGGGILASGVSTNIATIESSTIVNNTATMNGGGINIVSTTNPINLHNTIVANNTASGTAPDIFGSVVSQGYNLIENVTGSTITGSLVGNILGQDPILLPLGNNGGATFTHALGISSPAIDTGDTGSFQANDQRGVIRPIDGNLGNLIAQPDIGSFEKAAPTAADSTISGRVFSANGRGLARARVVLTDTNGSNRYAITNQFGYYRFTEVESGQIYIIGVTSKRFTFTPKVISVDESLDGIDFSPNSQKPEK
jgi:Carboxypeptidase regulatory-like domain